jgi:hypothetical protein
VRENALYWNDFMTQVQATIKAATIPVIADDADITYNRFHCPDCGDKKGHFGTFTFHEIMAKSPESEFFGKGYKTGDQIGYCKAGAYIIGGCMYKWVRTEESDKAHFIKEVLKGWKNDNL